MMLGMDKPDQRPEGALVQRRIKDELRISYNKAAEMIGLSDAWLRNIIYGFSSHGGGQYLEVVASPERLARIAIALGITADELRKAGREDAAALLSETINPEGPGNDVPVGAGVDPEVLAQLAELEPDEVQRVKDFMRGIKSGG